MMPLDVRAMVSSIDTEKRTVHVTFSTGAPVERYDWVSGRRFREVLSLDPAHVRLERLNAGAPVLDSHSGWSLRDVLGTVERGTAAIEKGVGVAQLRFSSRADVDPVFRDIQDRILGAVSIGYRVYKFVEEAGKDGAIPTRTAVDWEPFEVSMVPMPADVGAKVRSGDTGFTNPCAIETRAHEELIMSENDPNALTAVAQESPVVVSPSQQDVRQEAVTAERARVSGIQTAVRAAGLDRTFEDRLVSSNVSLDQARGQVLDALVQRQEQAPTRTGAPIAMGEDARDRARRGMMAWLFVRTGVAGLVAKHEGARQEDMDPGEFRGMTLLDLAKESLVRAGASVRGLGKMDLAGLALTHRAPSSYQTTSDFANLLENALHKILRASYNITPDTWSRWCGIASVSDFRAHIWHRLGALTVLDDLNEHGEFKNKAIPDSEKATYNVGTKGNIIAITRQVIVNDDMNAMARLTEALGRAGKLTIEKAAFALLAQNSGLGPTMSDTQPLFHANRSNVGTGAALAAAALDADRVVMAQQLEPGGQDYTDLRPAILLLPVGLGGQARIINQSQYDPDNTASGSKAVMKPNVVAGLFRDVVDTPRISGTRRYLFADPSQTPVFVVSFLDGQREPVLETQDGWRIDGVEMKARLDVGVNVVDWRGAVTNAGV